jgi:hypothetical protein
MKKFIALYLAPTSALEQMKKATPEQMKAGMDAWMAWFRKHEKLSSISVRRSARRSASRRQARQTPGTVSPATRLFRATRSNRSARSSKAIRIFKCRVH